MTTDRQAASEYELTPEQEAAVDERLRDRNEILGTAPSAAQDRTAAIRHEVGIIRHPSGWWWNCACGSLGGGWPNRDLALDEAELHLAKAEEGESDD